MCLSSAICSNEKPTVTSQILYCPAATKRLFSTHALIFPLPFSYNLLRIYALVNTTWLLEFTSPHRRQVFEAPFTLYRITSERSDFHTGFGCCLHYTTPIRYAPRSENHSALDVIQKVIRYVPEQCEQ